MASTFQGDASNAHIPGEHFRELLPVRPEAVLPDRRQTGTNILICERTSIFLGQTT
jgi:hypothetical protein